MEERDVDCLLKDALKVNCRPPNLFAAVHRADLKGKGAGERKKAQWEGAKAKGAGGCGGAEKG